MIELLEPLAEQPGVQLALLATHDGVPIASVGRIAGRPLDARRGGGLTKDDGLAAMAASWCAELGEAVAPLSWLPPDRVFLRGARGILVLHRMEGAILVVLLSRGLTPEDVRLSMEATIARVERTLERGRSTPPAPIPDPAAPVESEGSRVEFSEPGSASPPAGDS